METQGTLAGIRAFLEGYRLRSGHYPVVNAGAATVRTQTLRQLLSEQETAQGYGVSGTDRWTDAWGRPLYYAFSEQWEHGRYVLLSGGPDGRFEPENTRGHYGADAPENRDNLGGFAP